MMKLEPLIYVSDIFKSIYFYRDILGFKMGELYPDRECPTYAPIFVGDNKLMLSQARDSNKSLHQDHLGGSGLQMFIRVDNVDEELHRIKNQVPLVKNIENKPWGDREFTISDPDGYLISFYTPTK
jgi:uncharacterized glyoxalase superfamily protein PhnB